MTSPVLNCQTCGACCSNPLDGKWIEVTEEDAARLPLGYLQEGDVEKYAMKQLPSGRCIALYGEVGGKCGCFIYDIRPTICRKVQPMDSICQQLRNIHKDKIDMKTENS